MLPIVPHLPSIVEEVRRRRAVVVTAAPGAGKTTQLPPALVQDGPVLLLQPRRMAARSIAARIAHERGWTLGREVGWQVRFERRFAADTRLLVATEGILTARAQHDPLLSDFRTIVLDEFHERSIHADLGLALTRQAWLARADLRIVVMSATLDAAAAADYLDGCPVIEVPGRSHPLRIHYEPELTLRDAAEQALGTTDGDVLCFLPGAAEIRRAEREIAAVAGARDVEVCPLYGAMDAAAQDAVLTPGPRRRIVLSTNVAETSLTVPGVRAVVDTGRHKVARYDPERAIDSLTTERISQDAADQRAGRAGRLAAGEVWRLWARHDRLRAHREPDIQRIDLAGPALDILAWGADPVTFEWFEAPAAGAIERALVLLERLGALSRGRLTTLGRRMAALPLPPRLSRILVAGGGRRDVALACALLSERLPGAPSSGPATTANDLATSLDRENALPPHIRQVAARLQTMAAGLEDEGQRRDLRQALLDGYPDRVARRRAGGDPRVLMASGHGATIGPESGVRDGEFLLALDVTAGRREEAAEARIRLACTIERDWLQPTGVRIDHWIDPASGSVRAVSRDCYDALILRERPVPADPGETAALLATEYLTRGLSPDDVQWVRRMRFAGVPADASALVADAAAGRQRLADIDIAAALDWTTRQAVERHAPATLAVPSGRSVRLDYQEDGTVSAGVKLQELFGLGETPRLGPRQEPVLLQLLAPNGRPVQLTRDLRSFWERTYPEVRRELRGRYPKHPWPDDPWTAPPTARTTRRRA